MLPAAPKDHQKLIPVSRASFSLTDRNAFDLAIGLSVDWMSETAHCTLPNEIATALKFDFPGDDAKASISSFRLDDENGSIWTTRTTFMGDRVPGRRWITDLFVERRVGSHTRFGAQLTCQIPPNDPGFDHSRPNIIKNVISTLSAGCDGEQLTNEFVDVSEEGVDELIDLLYLRDRRLPVVLVSIDDNGRSQVNLDKLSNRISGAAHLRTIAIEPSFELTREVGKQLSTFNGAIRVYLPGLESGAEDPFRHPLWLAPASGWNPRVASHVADRVLRMGLRDAEGDARFWRVGMLRQVSSRAEADAAGGSSEENLHAEVEALRAELAYAKETASSAEALVDEAGEKIEDLEAEVAKLADENEMLRSKIKSGTSGVSAGALDISDIDNLHKGRISLELSLKIIANVLGDRVVVLESAYDSAHESRDFRFGEKAFDLLWKLATDYWTDLCDGESDVTARKHFGKSYAAKESETLSQAGKRRRTFEYNGQELYMEKHLKIGVADNRAETLRVHFAWVANEHKVVIGHCGEHLNF